MKRPVSFVCWVLMGWFFRLFLVKEIRGKENFSKKKNYILASNHVSHLDWLIGCYLCVPRKYTFIGQVDKIGGIAGALRDLMYWTGETIRVDRNDSSSRARAAAKAVEFVKKGYNLFMFPEGTRSRDGQLKTFKRGVGKIYLQTGAPILPVAMVGTYEMMPPGKKMKLNRSARIIIGKPREFPKELAAAKNMEPGSEAYLRLCETVAQSVEGEVRRLASQI